jgi:hypothetical protein
MTMRTLSGSVTFAHSFLLPGATEPQPAGTYDVEHEEESIEELTFPVYRRILTLLYVPGRKSGSRTFSLVPGVLEAILEHDKAAP